MSQHDNEQENPQTQRSRITCPHTSVRIAEHAPDDKGVEQLYLWCKRCKTWHTYGVLDILVKALQTDLQHERVASIQQSTGPRKSVKPLLETALLLRDLQNGTANAQQPGQKERKAQ